MRIAQIMLARGFGGAERSFVDLSLALAARGHEVLAVGDSRGLALTMLAAKPHIECVSLRCHGNWDLFARRAIRRHLTAFKPLLVQAHLARAALLGGRAAHDLGVPTLAKTHNLVEVKYYRDIDVLVPTTDAQVAHLRAHGIAGNRLQQIPNFSAVTPVATVDRAPGPPWIVKSVGRFVPKKGYATLLDAHARLLESGVQARLVIGGDGPERARLQQRAIALGIAATVEFPGWIDDVASFLRDAHVFVLPSHDEPFGIVLLEAMASSVPIVTTPTAGPSEILDLNSACFTARADAASMSAALVATLADYEAAGKRARIALKRFCENYSEDVVVARYLDLYAALSTDHTREREA